MSSSCLDSHYAQDELAQEKMWLKIRDLMTGQNKVGQNIALALQLAAGCEHEEAKYLIKTFGGEVVHSPMRAKNIFLEQGEADARALCFSEAVQEESDYWEEEPLRRSAELGYAPAQAMMAKVAFRNDCMDEVFDFASQAAMQRERDGFFWLGVYWESSVLEGLRARRLFVLDSVHHLVSK
jgi:hypothetical protein